jgi:hypothetical protein
MPRANWPDLRGRPRAEFGFLQEVGPRPVWKNETLERPVWPTEDYEMPPGEQLAIVFNMVSTERVSPLAKPHEVHVEMQSNGSKFDGRIMVLHMANGLLEFYEENPDNGIRIGDYLRFRMTEEIRNGELKQLFWGVRGGSPLRQVRRGRARCAQLMQTQWIEDGEDIDDNISSRGFSSPRGSVNQEPTSHNTAARSPPNRELFQIGNELEQSLRNLRRNLPGTLLTQDAFFFDPEIATEPRLLPSAYPPFDA